MSDDLDKGVAPSAIPQQRLRSQAVATVTSIARPRLRPAFRVACIIPRAHIDLADAIEVVLARSHKVATVRAQVPLTTKALVNDVSSQWAASLIRFGQYERMCRLQKIFRDNAISILHMRLADWDQRPSDRELEASRAVLDAFVSKIDLDLIVLSGQERVLLVFNEDANRRNLTSVMRLDDTTDWERGLAHHVTEAMAESNHRKGDTRSTWQG